jgi:hypothetical protein
MSHETEIKKVEKLDNGQWVIVIRCCANPSTDYRHTMDAGVMADPTKKLESISDARLRAAQEHEKAMAAEQAALDVVGERVKHE